MSLKSFMLGLTTRLIGAAMIWLGDGHTSLLSKCVVVCGVILSIGGIAVLRFMLFKSLKAAHIARKARIRSPE